jgi:two-component system phosphate regulon sensor histidine kinase PhoR
VLLNLADNAVKYNRPGGRIEFALEETDGQAVIRVTNTGPGVAAEDLPRVFERFHRGNTALRPEVEGCGLGLSVAQWIVQAHQGTIRLQSPPGGPTTVTVQLPLA